MKRCYIDMERHLTSPPQKNYQTLKMKLLVTYFTLNVFKQEASQVGSLPLRQVRAHCDCLHSGDRSHGHFVHKIENIGSKVVIDKSGCLNVREKSDMAPPQTKAIDILLEISLKERISPKLFARMKMTYTLAMKSILTQVKETPCLSFKSIVLSGSSL